MRLRYRGEAVDFTDRPQREVGAIIRRLMHVTERARLRAPDAAGRLFVAASVTQGYELRIAAWAPNKERSGLVDWLAAAGVAVDGAPDIRRLRKSTKVEKAIAFGGRIADAANDHHEEVFRGHYAQGTTLRVMSGRVISTAQDHWFNTALRTDRAHQLDRGAGHPEPGGGVGPDPTTSRGHPPRSTRHGTDPVL